MGKSAPQAPDYGAIAGKQGQISKELLDQQTAANRPTVYTPWGSQTWSSTPGGTRTIAGTSTNGAQFDAQRYMEANPDVAASGMGAYDHFQKHGLNEGRQGFWQDVTVQDPAAWEQRITLSPEQQAALDSQMAIQRGRSQGAQTLLDQAVGNFQRPMDWNSLPQRASSVQAGQLQGLNADPRSVNGQGPQSRVFSFGGGGDPSAPVRSVQGMGPLVNWMGGSEAPNTQGPQSGPLRNSVRQRGAATGVQADPIQRQLTQDPNDWRQTAQDAVWNLQKPMLDEQQAGLETQLSNQGLARGSEAWNSAMRTMGDTRARAQIQAIEAGRNEAGQLFNQDLQSGQFANSAQAQQFGQGLSNANLYNAAQQQMFGQGVTNANLNNAAQGQQFAQDLQSRQFENQAAQQSFQNSLQNAALNNSAQQQQFNAGVQSGQFANQAAQQQFNNTLQNNQFANQAGQQLFNQDLQRMGFENQAGQQTFQNLLQQAQFGNQQAAQQLNMMLQAGSFNNQNRQQAIAEEQMRRGQTLNELNALLTGQQVNMPTMPSFVSAGRAETPNLMGAAQNQYQSNLDAFNAQQAGTAGMMSGLFSLGSAFAGNPTAMAGLFGFGR